jgi:two-component system, chemotaxis family, CheB/CheR fusion protein
LKNKHDNFYIIGIGASAGGLGAFESFFSAIPTENNIDIAFVVIQHLAPNHKSLLTELIQRCTNMKVYEVENAMKVQKNCIYIIPPNYDMKIYLGTLYLENIPKMKSQHLPINLFFNSLAKDKLDKSIAIVLSGTGSDGKEGIKAIKEVRGFVLAQSIESAKSDGMPKSAISTGIVDNILSPDEMPEKIVNYVRSKMKNNKEIAITIYEEKILKEIFLLLQNETSHDFSMYKPSTMCRRIE